MARRPPVTLDASAFEAAAVKQPDPVAVAVAKSAPKAAPKPVQAPVAEIPKAPAVVEAPSNSKQKSRAGLVAVQTWITPEKRKQLKILSITEGKTMEDLLEAAIDQMIKK